MEIDKDRVGQRTEIVQRLTWLARNFEIVTSGHEMKDNVTSIDWGTAGAKMAIDLIEAQDERIRELEKYRSDAQVFANEKHSRIIDLTTKLNFAMWSAEAIQRNCERACDALLKITRVEIDR